MPRERNHLRTNGKKTLQERLRKQAGFRESPAWPNALMSAVFLKPHLPVVLFKTKTHTFCGLSLNPEANSISRTYTVTVPAAQ